MTAVILTKLRYKMDGWMTCDFTPFLTVMLLYQDVGKVIIGVFLGSKIYIVTLLRDACNSPNG